MALHSAYLGHGEHGPLPGNAWHRNRLRLRAPTSQPAEHAQTLALGVEFARARAHGRTGPRAQARAHSPETDPPPTPAHRALAPGPTAPRRVPQGLPRAAASHSVRVVLRISRFSPSFPSPRPARRPLFRTPDVLGLVLPALRAPPPRARLRRQGRRRRPHHRRRRRHEARLHTRSPAERGEGEKEIERNRERER